MPDTALPQAYRLRPRDIRRAADRAARSYDKSAVLQAEILDRLLERLGDLPGTPHHILDAGCRTGRASRLLAEQFAKARTVAFDLSLSMLAVAAHRCSGAGIVRPVSGHVTRLPFRSATFDLVVSNLLLHWCNDIPAILAEVRRVLSPGGRFLFSLCGRDTLRELRAAWAGIDDYTHVNFFHDMHDIGDMVAAAGFAEIVMDVDTFTLTYPDVEGLIRDLKSTGAGNITAGRRRSLAPREIRSKLIANYEAWRQEGRLPATVEVIYGQALAPETGAAVSADGEVRVPVSDITRRGS